jgi:photosystem II stability/assembly factor-like uncharacterized protein
MTATRWRTRAGIATAATIAVIALFAPASVHVAVAHTPHDWIFDVEPSPRFDEDRTVYAIVRDYLLRSTDAGDTWVRLVRGLDNQHRISAIEIAPGDPRTIYAGTDGDGVYRSTDGGASWVAVNDGLPELHIVTLAVSPQSPRSVFATVVVDGALAVFRSDDGGDRWGPLPGAGKASAVSFAASDPGLVVSGTVLGRVRLSRDGGSTWREVLDVGDAGRISALAPSPRWPEDPTLYVATRAGGLFVTRDAGRSFTRLDTDVTGKRIVSVALSPDFADDSTLWVSTWEDGVFESTDGGASWSPRSEGLTTNEQADLLGAPGYGQVRVAAGTGPGHTLYLAGFDGLFRSTPDGRWEELVTQPATNIVAVAISPSYAEDGTLAVATYINGALLSTDRGRSWRAINDGLAHRLDWIRAEDYFARLINIAFSPTFADDDTMFASQRGYVLRSEDGGDRWTAATPEGLVVADEAPPDYAAWAFSPGYERDHTVVLGTNRGKVFRSTDGGRRFTKIGQLDDAVNVLATSPAFGEDDTVIAGTTAGVHLSSDGGSRWRPSGVEGIEITGLVISPAFGDDRTAFAGTAEGLFVTHDGAASWELVGTPFSEQTVVEAVAVSPSFASDRTVLVSARGRGLFRSTDGGATFEPVAASLLARNVVLGNFYHGTTEPLLFSPDYERDRTVFGFAETRLFRSVDGGETWEDLAVPRQTHDLDPGSSPVPLLERAEPASAPPDAGDDGDDGGGSNATTATVAAVVAAALVAVVVLLGRRARRTRSAS